MNSVDFDTDFKHIVAMKSLEGEVVPLQNKVLVTTDVEVRYKNTGICKEVNKIMY